MTAAFFAEDFGAVHAVFVVLFELDVLFVFGVRKAGPAGAGVEFCV